MAPLFSVQDSSPVIRLTVAHSMSKIP